MEKGPDYTLLLLLLVVVVLMLSLLLLTAVDVINLTGLLRQSRGGGHSQELPVDL